MSFEIAYADGQLAALTRYKLGWPAPTNPTVAGSAVLRAKASPTTLSPNAAQSMSPPTTPFSIARESGQHERLESQNEPLRKLSATICTSCRKPKHYGPCRRPRNIPEKAAAFNPALHGSDAPDAHVDYTSAVHAVGNRSRALEGRAPTDQAATGFADLIRHQGLNAIADEPGQQYGALGKVARVCKLADFMLPDSTNHAAHEQRGPSVNPYEERRTRLTPPVAAGVTDTARIDHAFRAFDNPVDSANIGGGFGDPQPGPAVLG